LGHKRDIDDPEQSKEVIDDQGGQVSGETGCASHDS
jgi:hypothetical protein